MKSSRAERLKEQNRLLRIRDDVEKELKKIPGVFGVGVGLKEKAGEITEEFCFRVYVHEKKAKKNIPDSQLIPKEIQGVKTDVLIVREEKFIAEDNSKYRPLQGGIQIGNNKSSSIGTLGCIATLDADGSIVLLSNHHVLFAGSGGIGDKVGQPTHSSCCCCTCNEIGIILDGEKNATVDCAIARITSNEGFTNEIKDIGWIAGTNLAVVGDRVRKRGRTTRLTEGTVTDVVGKVEITPVAALPPFASFGDSGSVVINDDNEVVGLLYAIDVATMRLGFANHIAAVVARLGITINRTGSADSIPLLNSEKVQPHQEIQMASFTHFLKDCEKELKETVFGREILESIYKHHYEAISLVNHNREVKVAWNRYQGPSFVAHFMKNSKEDHYMIPESIQGITLQNLLIKMAVVLEKNGSLQLAQDVDRYAIDILNYAQTCRSVEEFLEKIKQKDKRLENMIPV